MIDGLRPFPESKPSAVPWLGDVPAHWGVLRSKYAFREVDSRSTTGEETHLSMSQRLGLVPANQVERTLVSESYVGAKLVAEDDLVLNRLKAHLGVFAYAKQPGLISPDYTVLRPLSCTNVRFFEYVLKSPACRAELRTRAKGIVEGFWRLYTDDFYDIRLPIPSLDEQRLIVRFLDWHGAQTAKLIRAKKKIIALLNEQKQAIIHRAVTRGLDPNVRVKPSGIPWLGDVPEGWEVVPVLACYREKNTKNIGMAESTVLSLSYGRIIIKRPEKLRGLVPVSFETYQIIEPGNIIVRSTDLQNDQKSLRVGIARDRGIITSAYMCLRTIGKMTPEFGYQILNTYDLLKIIYGYGSGLRQNLGFADIRRMPVPLPPPEQQVEIVNFLGQATAEATRAVEHMGNEIALIQEFRTRLIADVVTGKLDVRAVAASLPETSQAEPIEDLVEGDDLDDAVDDAENEEVAA